MAKRRKKVSGDPFAANLHSGVREIYRDDTLWVLDKPAGVLTHPNPPGKRASNVLLRTVYDYERELYRVTVEGEKQRQLHLVHRLDQETSGLIICTFSPSGAADLRKAFYEGDVHKEYRALVLAPPRARRGEWRDCLSKSSGRGDNAQVRVTNGRPNAVTTFQVMEKFDCAGLALLSLRPETGRTHQLRVQAAAHGHPIAGDTRYGDFDANRRLAESTGLKRMFLHAFALRLRHPQSGHLLRFEAPLTSRLAEPLERVRQVEAGEC